MPKRKLNDTVTISRQVFVTAAKAAKVLKISYTTTCNYIDQGIIPVAHHFGAERMIKLKDLKGVSRPKNGRPKKTLK